MKELKIRGVAVLRKSVLILIFLYYGFANATTWYVSKTGNDTLNGKFTTFSSGYDGPKLTVNAAIALASAGDTLMIDRGVYVEKIELGISLYIQTDSVVMSHFEMNGSNISAWISGDTLEFSDSFILTDGIVYLTNPSFFLFCQDTCELVGGYEWSFVEGRLHRQLMNGFGTHFYPVGVSGDYRPANIDYNQNIPDSRIHWVQVHEGAAPVPNTLPVGIRNFSNRHYWHFGRRGTGQPTDYIVRLFYDSAGLDDEAYDPNYLRVLHGSSSGVWENLGGTGNAAFTGSVKASNSIDTVGYFTIGNAIGGVNPLGSFIPFAGFNASGHCEKSPTSFLDTSFTMSPATINSWYWDFGDPLVTTDTSTAQNPSYTYNSPGTYTIKLIVTNDSLLSDSSELIFDIHAMPVVNFSNSLMCLGQSTLLNDLTTTTAPDTVFKRLWDLGDGNMDSVASFSHTYLDTGNTQITLYVMSSAGCVDSNSKIIRVNPVPLVGFQTISVCKGVTSQFLDTSKISGPDNISSWFWKMGDGNTKSGISVNHVYATEGDYNVRLVVTSNAGCMDSVDKSVKVRPLPKVYIENGPVCFGQLSRFKDTSKVALPETIASNSWNLGDGTISSGKSISYPYGVAGLYNIKLIVTTTSGCKDSATAVAVVNPKPTPDFISAFVCIGETSTFTRIRSTTIPDNQITYSWFDNYSLKKTDTTYTGILAGAGDHRITLLATTNKGCKDSMVLTETVYSKPKIVFYLDKNFAKNDSLQCLKGNKFTFFRKATAGQSQTVTGEWLWGDGSTGTLLDSTHSYSSENTYSVKLRATTSMGCKDSVSKNYVVRGQIKPNIGKMGVCTPDSITFYDSGTISTSTVTSKTWVLPDGSKVFGNQTRQWIKQAGPIDMKLISTNAEGCTDSISKSYFFTPYPVISFLVTGSLPFCPGDSIAVKADGGLKMLWTFDNDTNRTKIFKTGGYYKVRANNSPACFVEDSFFVVLFPPANIKASKDTIIYRGSKATLKVTGGQSYTWSPATTLNQNFGPSVLASPLDTQMYMVTGQSIDGCTGRDTVVVYIVDRDFIRIPNLITPNGDGENDAWVLSDLKALSDYDVTITNYAGKIVFQSSNYLNDWNAMEDGKELPEGVFYYQLENRRTGDAFKGYIQVIR